jgi:hypothetical protein
MRSFEAGVSYSRRALIVGCIAVVLLLALANVLRTVLPPDAVTIRSAASLCRRDYASARTAADTASIDDRVWQINNRTWRRLPSCGELRIEGKL